MLLYTNASSGVLRDIILLPISLPIDTLIQTVFYKGRVPSITSFFLFTFHIRGTNNIYSLYIYFCIFCTLVSIHKSQLFLFMGHSKQLTVKLQGLCCPWKYVKGTARRRDFLKGKVPRDFAKVKIWPLKYAKLVHWLTKWHDDDGSKMLLFFGESIFDYEYLREFEAKIGAVGKVV